MRLETCRRELLSPATLLSGLLAAAASAGFAVFFNVPPRALAACAISGALAYLTRLSLSVGGGVNAELATFVAATFAGVAGTLWGRRLHSGSSPRGFVKNSSAPAFIARTVIGTSPIATDEDDGHVAAIGGDASLQLQSIQVRESHVEHQAASSRETRAGQERLGGGECLHCGG